MIESKPKSKKEFKPPRKPTAQRLANIALHHLDRYASSAENLRRVLERRVFKAARHYEHFDMDAAKGWIDALMRARCGVRPARRQGLRRKPRALVARAGQFATANPHEAL